jgi:DNA-binding transcriptional LysR family regulator
MIDFSIRELESFVAVAEELSFTRAARRLRLSQPPLSRQIQSLETRLGVRLFARTPRSVALTSAGRAFLADTKGALAQLQRAADKAKRASRGETTRLDIGFVSAVLNPALIDIFHRYRTANPDVQLNLQDCPPAEQVKAIGEGRLDGGFIGASSATQTHGLTFIPWSREPLMAFLPRSHRLHRAPKLKLADLSDESFVMVAAESAPCFSQLIYQLCSHAGFRPNVVQEAIRGQAVVAMVAAGAGIAILPASMAKLAGDSAAIIPLAEKAAAVAYVFALRPGAKPPALENLIAVLPR